MFRYPLHRLGSACAAVAIAAALPLAAHAAVSRGTMNRTERVLAAAGFQVVPANTPERRADMATLRPGRLIAQPQDDGYTYIFADPAGCDCLYLGNAAAYQAYQHLALEQRIAQQNADDYSFGRMNWDLWGPYDGWGWQPSRFPGDGQFGGHAGGGHHQGSGHH